MNKVNVYFTEEYLLENDSCGSFQMHVVADVVFIGVLQRDTDVIATSLSSLRAIVKLLQNFMIFFVDFAMTIRSCELPRTRYGSCVVEIFSFVTLTVGSSFPTRHRRTSYVHET